jgi:iron complex transport system ATP-binding protein
MSFRAASVGFAYGLDDVTFTLPPRGFVAVAGPNGAGKSTLLGILAGLREPYRGSCAYRDKEVSAWNRRDFARRVAFLPQSSRIEFPFTAQEVVFMGRTPYAHGWLESPEDHAAVQHAMQVTETVDFGSRDFRTLSGGERQRVLLASALAQQPETLLLDEPATFLDLKHQLAMYRLLSDLAANVLIVAVTHDLNLALQFSNRMLLLDRGRLAGDGATRDILIPERIHQVFGVRARLHPGVNLDGMPPAGPHLTYEA